MGGSSSCADSKPPDNAEAQSIAKKKGVAYKWYGLHVLSANCSVGDTVYYTKELNIAGFIALGMFVLAVLFIVMKMMHKKSEAMAQPFAGLQ